MSTFEDYDESALEFVRTWSERASRLEREGLYDPASEHEACGVGLIAAIDGQPRRSVVEAGINALKAVWHRGAVDADGKTGDGAGIHVQIPQDFFKEHIARTGHEPSEGRLAVGTVFLPKTDFLAQERCREIVETEILHFGYEIYGWRQVPIDTSVIGEKANATRPEIEQIMIDNRREMDDVQFERDLFLMRRRIERRLLEEQIAEFYFCSLSCRSLIYKGMFLAEQLTDFYPDLLDNRFISNFAIYHQRYSTNTFPTWRMAQPFRLLAHNGEINTLRGNVNWMKSHEMRLASDFLGKQAEEIKPIIQPGSSDSAALDAVYEALVMAGRSAPMAKVLMIPDSWPRPAMPAAHQALYSYANGVMAPWDGPAAIAATDGRWVVAGMDRNGLRPLRYTITDDGILIVGSEAGMIPLPETNLVEKGRVGPGQMIGVDLEQGQFFNSDELVDQLVGGNPYEEWVKDIVALESVIDIEPSAQPLYGEGDLRRRLLASGYSAEDLEVILHPMAGEGKEPTGSMGDDTPLAVLSSHNRQLHHYFRQVFSQVTNPPIDSLREQRVMTLKTRLGNLGNVFEEDESQTDILVLESPVLSTSEFNGMVDRMGNSVATIDATFSVVDADKPLTAALDRIRHEAEDAVRGGKTHLVLSDENTGPERAAVPMILAAGGVHTHLVRNGLRTYTSLNVRSAECMDVHYCAVLIGVGSTTINPYLAEAAICDRYKRGLFPGSTLKACIERYMRAVDQGLLKIMSKIGISVLSSYRGGYYCEAVGLSRSLVAEFFPGMPSRISGIGLSGLKRNLLALHGEAYEAAEVVPMALGGLYRYRRGEELHAFDGQLIHILQSAVASDSYGLYRRYSQGLREMGPVHLRDLLDFEAKADSLPLDEVESVTGIRKRFSSGSMSHGSLSREAHETLAIAMNRIGAASCSGEGGEDGSRARPRPNGDNANSAIKQIASGRFGVTAEYLNNCNEIEIKIAQGAKPGEGGQLPGFKVTEEIACLRLSTPGVTLISPPPHHDIYSIEDLAQLIYDLKQINPTAQVCVKLVSESGIGTIAAGVAKAKADVILISGHSGGTGASPQSSIKFAGTPWEMGLAEVNQVLTLNRLRHRVRLRVDGGLKSGRDIVIAAMLGAEEFGIGTTSLVAMGCIMVRQCHSNTCPVGVCTQDPVLREKFMGTPEKVVNLFSFVAEEVREVLASLGVRSIEDVVGRTDMLTQVSRGSRHLDDLDLNPLLVQADPGDAPRFCTLKGRNEVPDTLDAQMIDDAQSVFDDGEKMQLSYNIRNTQRAIGARLSSHLVRRFGMSGLQPGHLTVRLRGSAGQSLGAFAVQGLKLEVFGDANDYVGKGLSGGDLVVRPMMSSPLVSNENVIVGNVVLYGATGGTLFVAGQAGDRFAVRNSGAVTVVEGCGDNGCEYMTGGTAIILGAVGDNFAAGMTGGMAFVYDPQEILPAHINGDSVVFQRLESTYWENHCRKLISRHASATQSAFAHKLLAEWTAEIGHFWQVCPIEMVDRLEHPLSDRLVTATA